MEITLTPELQQYVEQKVAAGKYPSINEMLNTLLQRDQAQEEIDEETGLPVAELKRLIAEGDACYERGAYVTLNRETGRTYFENMIARLNAEFDARQAAGK